MVSFSCFFFGLNNKSLLIPLTVLEAWCFYYYLRKKMMFIILFLFLLQNNVNKLLDLFSLNTSIDRIFLL